MTSLRAKRCPPSNSSRPAVLELAARYRDIVIELEAKHTVKGAETQQQLEEAEKKLQGSQARKDSEKNILVNDLDKAFRVLASAQKEGKKERRVDIVLDNAGFELFLDLILAGYLIASGLATTVKAEGQLMLRPNDFWTAGESYWRLPKQEPDLCEDLKDAELVILKGDLNYRKLTADAAWTPTEPFAKAIGPMGPKSGIRVLALRTCKADVVVGLPEGEDERIRKLTGDEGEARKWAWSGKWAVVQFSDGKA
ncbi:hypothetical protein EJ02DRAFT_516753 [Clathrospora elynae]|uniref:Sugar phosphate phosphatase n=1 Tax=Clathrospora elynae TaxID=706981 RepID=A0A6A5S661_9PLEO|nr:hypothetical protein EJ02DRAFT_516753 [Clathrospora elynae]